MTHQIRQTFFSKTLIDFLENLGKEKDGQLRTKLLLSANLLQIIYDNFPTEEEFLKAVPYMADVEREILADFLPDINLIKNHAESRSSCYYDKIFIMAMFIAQELIFNLKNQKSQYSEEYKHINRAINEVLAGKLKDEPLEVVEEFVDKLDFFQNRRVIELINYRFHNKDFQAFLNYERNKSEVEDKIDEYSAKIIAKQKEITNYLEDKQTTVKGFADKLDNLRSSYNFVLLNKGFESLLDKKEKIASKLTKSLVVMSLLIVGWFIYNLHYNQSDNISWERIAVGVGLELILIYFFRVILLEYNSLKTQIMQLELRVSLCQFIQDYTKYAKEIKQDDKEALEKFENVVFSNILADSRDMPSTFDSMEQIGNFIKNIKG